MPTDAPKQSLYAGLGRYPAPLQVQQVDQPCIRQDVGRLVDAADDDQAAFVGDQVHGVVLTSAGGLASSIYYLELSGASLVDV